MSILTRATFQSGKDTVFADNTNGDITAENLRDELDNLSDSAVFRKTDSYVRVFGVASGTANALTLTSNDYPTAYTANIQFMFKAASNNTGAATININSIGAVDLEKSDGSALAADDLVAGSWYQADYDTASGDCLIVDGIGGGATFSLSFGTANQIPVTDGASDFTYDANLTWDSGGDGTLATHAIRLGEASDTYKATFDSNDTSLNAGHSQGVNIFSGTMASAGPLINLDGTGGDTISFYAEYADGIEAQINTSGFSVNAITAYTNNTDLTLSGNGTGDVTVSDNLNVTGLFNLGAVGALEIASGAITVTKSFHTVDVEGGAASTDDLDTISGGTLGDLIILTSLASARDIVLKHDTGNIVLNGAVDFTLTDRRNSITLIQKLIGATPAWIEVSRSTVA